MLKAVCHMVDYKHGAHKYYGPGTFKPCILVSLVLVNLSDNALLYKSSRLPLVSKALLQNNSGTGSIFPRNISASARLNRNRQNLNCVRAA